MINDACGILVADDDKFIRDRLEKMFAKAGYLIKTARSGSEAVGIISRGGISVAVIDYHMEDMNGDDVIEAIKAGEYKVMIIVMTGDESLELERRLRAKGVFAYFMKPLELELLKRTVEAAKLAAVRVNN